MIKYALVISFAIVTSLLSGGFAYSADQDKTDTQETGKKELQIKKSVQETSPIEERERVMENDFLSEMERFFENQIPGMWQGWRYPRYWRRPLSGSLFDEQRLRVDVIEKEDAFLIKAELPGVDKNDIQITISDNLVTIKADTSKEEQVEKGDYYRREISRGSYSRSLMLPARVKEGEAKATFEGGVLELTIPKQEKSKRTNVKVI